MRPRLVNVTTPPGVPCGLRDRPYLDAPPHDDRLRPLRKGTIAHGDGWHPLGSSDAEPRCSSVPSVSEHPYVVASRPALRTTGGLTMTGPDVTRREVLEAAAVTGGALVGGQLMPGTTPPAAAQDAAAA